MLTSIYGCVFFSLIACTGKFHEFPYDWYVVVWSAMTVLCVGSAKIVFSRAPGMGKSLLYILRFRIEQAAKNHVTREHSVFRLSIGRCTSNVIHFHCNGWLSSFRIDTLYGGAVGLDRYFLACGGNRSGCHSRGTCYDSVTRLLPISISCYMFVELVLSALSLFSTCRRIVISAADHSTEAMM